LSQAPTSLAAGDDALLDGGLDGRDGQRLFVVLVLLEFEVRCWSCSSELLLKNFVDQASTQEPMSVESLLAMAKIAAAASNRRLAAYCLHSYLRALVGVRGATNYSQCAVAYRELIALQTSRNESFELYDGILQLLAASAAGIGAAAGDGRAYPKEEIAWLVASAWNNGCHFYRLQQYKWGERWMGKSLALLKHCPGAFPEEAMTKSYMECLQHCVD